MNKQVKPYFNQFIGVYENLFDVNWCNSLVDLFEEYRQNNNTHKRKGEVYDVSYLNDEVLDLLFVKNLKDKRAEIIKSYFDKIIYKAYDIYSRKYITVHPNQVYVHSLQIQKTLPSEGFHNWHCEFPTTLENEETLQQKMDRVTRFAVYTVYLNDIEEGGETEFLYQSLRVSPKKGTLCIFPAGYTHQHRGNPPLKGNKYILTGWFQLKT